MNSNWFKLVMKMTKVEYGKNLLLKGVPIIFNKGGAKLKIGENVTIKSSFLSNLVGLLQPNNYRDSCSGSGSRDWR